MKLVIAVLEEDHAGAILGRLHEKGFGATRLASTGGFLRRGNTTVLVGVEDDRVEEVLAVLREGVSRAPVDVPREAGHRVSRVEVGAMVFVVPVTDFLRV